MPVLVTNGVDSVRVKWGEKPRRKANQAGEELSATPGPEQFNTLAAQIKSVETALLAKTAEQTTLVPLATRYMLLSWEQDWELLAAELLASFQCPAPAVVPSDFPLRVEANGHMLRSAPRFPWSGKMVIRTRSVASKWWANMVYGAPVGLGVVTGMIWNRRDVLCAPVSFSLLFAGVRGSLEARVLSPNFPPSCARMRRVYELISQEF